MADFTYEGPAGRQAPGGRRVANLANWTGAAVSLALMCGVGVWGYKLLVRDVTGIPVVQAMEGPMRIAPRTRAARSRIIRGWRSTVSPAPAPRRPCRTSFFLHRKLPA